MRTWAVVIALLGLGAGPPEVVRVRVPSAQVKAWFPEGSELRSMPLDTFDDLVKAAREGAGRASRTEGNPLLRAHHFARWEEGTLVGRTELELRPDCRGSIPCALEPWSPTITAAVEAPAILGNRPDGRLLLAPGRSGAGKITIHWQQSSRPGSDGRVFGLGLPQLDASSLVLDLPAGLVPEGPGGLRVGPQPGATSERSVWRFQGQGGSVELRLRSRKAQDPPAAGVSFWVGGSAEWIIEGAGGRWTADWTVDSGLQLSSDLVVDLEAGLDLIDVTGPDVVSFHAEPAGKATRLVVRLSDERSRWTTISLRGLARVPAEGRWRIPAARLVNGSWTGGQSTVLPDGSRVLAAVRPLASQRLPSGDDEESEPGLLVFETWSADAIAELEFRRPAPESTVEVRGQLHIGGQAPRLEARLTWHAEHGRVSSLSIDLPAPWVADRAQIAASLETLAWHSEPRPGGGSRVQVVLPTALIEGRSLTLQLAATAASATDSSRLALPRVRPVGARVSDEMWVAQVDSGWAIRPVSAHGLAWVDPVFALAEPVRPFATFLGLRGALAWRWNEPGAAAQVERFRIETAPQANLRGLIAADGERIESEWLIVLDLPESAPRRLLLTSTEPLETSPRWQMADDASGPILPSRVLGPAERASRHLERVAAAWLIDLPRTRSTRLSLRTRLSRPWSGSGRVPLFGLPQPVEATGTVVLLCHRGAQSSAQARSLRRLDPTEGWRRVTAAPSLLTRDGQSRSLTGFRRAHAFDYEGLPGSLELKIEPLKSGPSAGFIPEAVLTTFAAAEGMTRHRLDLHAVTGRSQQLAVRLPGGARLERALRDNQLVQINERGDDLLVQLDSPVAGHPACDVVLEYLSPPSSRPAAFGTWSLSPDLPRLSLPCLSLCWELVTGSSWAITEVGPAFQQSARSTSRPSNLVTDLARMWRSTDKKAVLTREQASMLKELDATAASVSKAPATLGQLCISWDAGRWPVVIDRPAVASLGLGPLSPLAPGAGTRKQSSSVEARLGPLGLAAVPLDRLIVVTSQEQAARIAQSPGMESDYRRRAIQAAASGSDPLDRLQSAARWRGESMGASGPRSAQAERFSASVSTAERTAGAWLFLTQTSTRSAWIATIVAGCLWAGIAGRSRSARLRGAVLAALVVASLATWAWASPPLGDLAVGSLAGCLAVICYWLGRTLRPARLDEADTPTVIRRERATIPQRSASSTAVISPIVLLGLVSTGLFCGAVAQEEAQTPDDRPIVALLPFDGQPDLHDRRAPVWILLKDFERLRSWAEVGRTPAAQEAIATSARHRITWPSPGKARVESRFGLHLEGAEAAWVFPVGQSTALSATLDGQSVPVAIVQGGQQAKVSMRGAGEHQLTLSREIILNGGVASAGFQLPVNPVAAARWDAEQAPGMQAVECNGRRLDRPAEPAEKWLGPADVLNVRCLGSVEPDQSPARPVVDGLLLWDILPAGDRLRARLTYHHPEGTGLVRLKLEPGLAVRAVSLPGLLEATIEGTAEEPVWVARVEPPLVDGQSLTVDLWRPLALGAGDEAQPVDENGAEEALFWSQPAARRLPRLEPLQAQRFSGLIGLRRPADWTGQLSALAGTELATDEGFLKAWGELEDESLSLAGALRFTRWPRLDVAVRPGPVRRSVKQSVRLVIEPGRVGVEAQSVLADLGAASFEAAAEVPADLEVLSVESDGLLSWSRPAPGRLRLQFDSQQRDERPVRIKGWLPVPVDAFASSALQREIAMPWPRWEGVDEQPGTLQVDLPPALPGRRAPSQTGAGIVVGPGATLIGGGREGEVPGLANRLTYRVDRPATLARLRWTAEPPRVTVAVQSILSVYPDSAAWRASVRYQVSGGSWDSVFLKLPTAWASAAEIEIPGMEFDQTTRADGAATTWTLRPLQPIWGSMQVLIRSSRPLDPARPLTFPDLVPLGWGTANTVMAISNQSGAALEYEGSPGLAPLEAARFPDLGLPGAASPISRAYQVRREGWTLQVRTTAQARGAADEPRVTLADLTCILAADGSSQGRASYALEPGPAAFLTVVLPPTAETLAAMVGDSPVQPLKDASGRSLIPLGDGAARRVTFVWRANRDANDPSALRLPGLIQANVPTLLTVYAPAQTELSAAAGVLVTVSSAQLEVERAERMARRIAARMDRIDRSSGTERQELVTELARFELQTRVAQRAVWLAGAERGLSGSLGLPSPVVDRLVAIRENLAEALRAGGLEDALSAASEGSGQAATADSATALRLRRLGLGHWYRTESLGPGQCPSLRIWTLQDPARWERPGPWLLTLLAAAAAGLAYLAVARVERPWALALAAIGLAAAGWGSGAIGGAALAAGLGLIAVGRFARS